MGFESFQVRLRDPDAKAAAIDAFLLSLPQVSVDHDAFRIGDSRYYIWSDAEHVVEIEVDRDPAQVSTRFMLCNPDSIASVFGDLLLHLHELFGGRLVICDEVPRDLPDEFTRANLGEFRDILREASAVRRAEWVAEFGPRVMAASSRDVFREIILPRCEPFPSHPSPTATRSHP